MIERILARAAAAGLEIDRAQAAAIEEYHRMLCATNARFNLTRVPDDPEEAIDRNYLDSLAPLRSGLPAGVETVIDVGSGAGFPGVPLAICCPRVRVLLMDSQGKRVDFLNEVVARLGLNAQALHLRAEDAARRPELREAFDLAVARAVAPMNLLAEYLLPFVRVGGHMLAYKGPTLEAELAQAQNAFDALGGRFARAERFELPGRDWDHRLAYVEKCAPTPQIYPRRAGKPEKKPL